MIPNTMLKRKVNHHSPENMFSHLKNDHRVTKIRGIDAPKMNAKMNIITAHLRPSAIKKGPRYSAVPCKPQFRKFDVASLTFLRWLRQRFPVCHRPQHIKRMFRATTPMPVVIRPESTPAPHTNVVTITDLHCLTAFWCFLATANPVAHHSPSFIIRKTMQIARQGFVS